MKLMTLPRASLGAGGVLLLTVLSASGQEGPTLRMAVESNKAPRAEVYVQGEPIGGRMIIENAGSRPLKVVRSPAPSAIAAPTSWRLHFEGDTALPASPYCETLHVDLGAAYFTSMAPGERVVLPWVAPRQPLPGHYEVWISYDPVGDGYDWFLDAQDLPRLKVESNHLKLQVVAATGLDAEAFEKYGRDNPCTTWWNGTWGQKMVADYPTSVYAGWVLLSSSYVGCQVPSWDLESGWSPDRPPSAALLEELRGRRQEQNEGTTRRALAAVEQLRNYLARRPDFPDADWMRHVIACNKLTAEDVEGARKMFKALLSKDDLPSRLREHAEAALAKVDEAGGRQ